MDQLDVRASRAVARTVRCGHKLRLIQLLARELAEAEDPPVLVPGEEHPVWSPYDAFAVADTLLDVLRDSKGASAVEHRATT